MMDTFNNYNELAIANDSAPYIPMQMRESGSNEPFDVGGTFVWNMAQFKSVPMFSGCWFFACSNESQNGGILEPPHIHIKLNTGRNSPAQKFWTPYSLSHVDREKIKQRQTITRQFNVTFAKGNASPEIQRAIIKHLNKNKDSVMREWNNYVKKEYSDYASYSLFPE